MTEVFELIERGGGHPVDIPMQEWPERTRTLRACDVFVIDEAGPAVNPDEAADVEEYCCEQHRPVVVLAADGAVVAPTSPLATADNFRVHHFSDSLEQDIAPLLTE
ncbi:MAG: hypothetical protein COT71_00010 [Candidatus Andersenbacteria bacterium CG10_big_fil_rev_8_21_14_0_10_54_11]|uniref:Uncharacterized protein n=1 Tax=Candidatus Andersenbacteria bacterium CG10_big_fil_rev_8_21_14_0_10_54_11 TaxID=1974485 RepID=A0A2M6X0L3_9BACT|nr:MAG: hypothetical protein COT71_00010 [Candidatus Andersenbacteria bacterium CG10_big_fil_rev_8_21_14_0_10_54_11]